MSRPTTLTRRVATVVATTALLVSGLAAGAAQAQDGSSLGDLGSSNNNPDLPRTATITHGNTTITREIVGNNQGYAGDTVTYRTTISATEGPAREITRVSEGERYEVCQVQGLPTATITYTSGAGSRVTDTVEPAWPPTGSDGYTVVGSWPIDAATGATVVYESTYKWVDPAIGPTECSAFGGPSNPAVRDTPVRLDISGLDTLNWKPTGVEAACLDSCDYWSLLNLPRNLLSNLGS